MTFDEAYRLVVSDGPETEWHNGKECYARRGERIVLSKDRADGRRSAGWRWQNVFVA